MLDWVIQPESDLAPLHTNKKLIVMNLQMKDLETLIGNYSKRASEYCHQLGIAGIVILWFLHKEADGSGYEYKLILLIALIVFISVILFSLSHYFRLAINADDYYHDREEELVESLGINKITELREQFVRKNTRIEKLSWRFFKLKFYTLFFGYGLVVVFILLNIKNI